jgi:hypothetical protein
MSSIKEISLRAFFFYEFLASDLSKLLLCYSSSAFSKGFSFSATVTISDLLSIMLAFLTGVMFLEL